MAVSRTVLFGAADRQAECFLDYQEFENSLVLNLLFHGNLAIPDVYFFISSYLVHHLNSSPESLIEVALRKGYVTPYFRDRSRDSFVETLKLCRSTSSNSKALLGLQENAEVVASRLDLAMQTGKIEPMYWPTWSVGEKYKETILKYIVNAECPQTLNGSVIRQEELQQYWTQTEKWRTEDVVRAIERTSHVPNAGLRRSELQTVLGNSIGINKDEIDDVRELLQHAVERGQWPVQMELMVRWIVECYQHNMAKALDVDLDFPSLGVASCLSKETSFTEGLNVVAPEDREQVLIPMKLPPIECLAKLDPRSLIDIREQLGNDFLAKLNLWKSGSKAVTSSDLIKCGSDYAKTISKRYLKSFNWVAEPVELLVSKEKWPIGNVIGNVAVSALASQFVDPTQVTQGIITGGALGVVTVKYLNTLSRINRKELLFTRTSSSRELVIENEDTTTT